MRARAKKKVVGDRFTTVEAFRRRRRQIDLLQKSEINVELELVTKTENVFVQGRPSQRRQSLKTYFENLIRGAVSRP